RKKDLRYYSMGGAYTSLIGHNLMAYYNPAAYAFSFPASSRSIHYFDDNTSGRSKSKNHFRLTLMELSFAGTMISAKTQTNLQTFLDVFSPIQGSIIPAPFDTIFTQLGMGALVNIPNNQNLDIQATLTNATLASNFLNTMLGLAELRFSAAMDLEVLTLAVPHFGFGIDLMMNMSVGTPITSSIPPGVPLPIVHLGADANVYTAMAFRFKSEMPMSVGFTAKVFGRMLLDADTDNKILALLSDVNAPVTAISSLISSPQNILTGNVNLGIASNYMKVGTGGGVDVGYLIEPLPNLRAGAMLTDLFSIIQWSGGTNSAQTIALFGRTNDVILPSIDVGVSYQLKLDAFGFFNDPLFAIGYTDIFNRSGDLFFKHLNAGLEFGSLFDTVKLRAGIYQGYPSFSAALLLNTRFLSQVPFVKVFFPAGLYTPLLLPAKWDFEGLLDFGRRNIFVFAAAMVLQTLSLFNITMEGGVYGLESGTVAGAAPDYQFSFLFRSTLTF
ncbi:MAG: hypothetical protein JNM63_10315, partial [Spirochaetia bacterium]|nr:hypothetical protein [Spirochaetia bacterium]